MAIMEHAEILNAYPVISLKHTQCYTNSYYGSPANFFLGGEGSFFLELPLYAQGFRHFLLTVEFFIDAH